MISQYEGFEENIVQSRLVLDPIGRHHQFSNGAHGRKLNFDAIEYNSPLYLEWVATSAAFIEEEYSPLPDFVLGVANGSNRLAMSVAQAFGGNVLGLISKKSELNSRELYLPDETVEKISDARPELVLVMDDVGTTGSNALQVAMAALEAGAKDVEVLYTWKRQEKLELLQEPGITYRAIINTALDTYSEEECRTEGFCARGWEYIPRGQ